MLVLFRHGMDDSTNIVLFGLSGADMVYSCSETYYRLMYITARLNILLGYRLSSFYLAIFIFISAYGTCTSVWLVSLISIERMIAVCFPFQVSRLMSPTRMRCMVVFVFTFVAVLYSPWYGRYYLEYALDRRNNKTFLTYFERKGYSDNKWWINIILDHILPAFASPVPMVTILMCTFATIIKLFKANTDIGRLSTSRTKRVNEMRSIKISLTICCCMAFSILVPNAWFDAFSSFGVAYIPLDVIIILRSFTQLVVQINATMNFFIYVALSPKFKSTCFNLIQCK
ncbi:unnamed protein product [Lymnaea stagnalis]|uniref:G-protein coupled receptors family 1 profile domain-containing protein n=1 Tax=Lymnaea stagnalis TaxID=6523 RepID=A0AAV2H6F7_LYMST